MDTKTVIYTSQFGDSGQVSLRFNSDDFDSNLLNLLKSMRFSALDGEDVSGHLMVLDIKAASARVQRQIGQFNESDQFGPESMTPRAGFSLYRYKGMALMLFSPAAKVWEMGVSEEFGQDSYAFETRVVISRVLSLALAKKGVIGFWGVPVKEGIVLMNSKESQGELVFIDEANQKVFSFDEERRLSGSFKVLRLDKTLSGRQVVMGREEVLGILSTRCSYFSYYGLPNNLKLVLRRLTDTVEGLNYPFDHFEPRSNVNP